MTNDTTMTMTFAPAMTTTMTLEPEAPARTPAEPEAPRLRERKGTFRHRDEDFARVAMNKALRQLLARAMREAGVQPSGEAWETAKRSLKQRLATGASVEQAIAGAVARVQA